MKVERIEAKSQIIFPLVLCVVWFSISVFFREARIAGLALCALVILLHMDRTFEWLQNVLIRHLVGLFALLLCLLLLQSFTFKLGFSVTLAGRQAVYFLLLPIVIIAMGIYFEKYANGFIRFHQVFLVVGSVFFLSFFYPPLTPESWLFRANIENLTAFGLLYFIAVRQNSTAATLLVIIFYAVFAFITKSGQGMMISVLCLAPFVVRADLRKIMIYIIGMTPLWFPLVILASQSFAQGLDANVNFRYNIWSTIWSDLASGELMLGKLGFIVNQEFVNLLYSFGMIGIDGLENVGAHNFVLQCAQLGGYPAFLMAILILSFHAVRVTRCSEDLPIFFAHVILSVSLTLNQAELHLLNLFGTGLLFAFIEVRRKQLQSKFAPESEALRA